MKDKGMKKAENTFVFSAFFIVFELENVTDARDATDHLLF